MALEVKQVHGAAASARAAGLLAEEFGHDGLGGNAAADGIAMFTVVGVDVVVGGQASTEADHGGLFAQVEMAIAPDAGAVVHLAGFFLKVAHQHHLRIVVQQRLAVFTLG